MNILRFIKRYIGVWIFNHGIGKLSRAYSGLSQQTERAAFAMENFGFEAWRANL